MKTPLELIKDTVSGAWRTLKPEEFKEAEEQITANRDMRRTAIHMAKIDRRGERPSGPGPQSKKKRGTGPRDRKRARPHRPPNNGRRRSHAD